MVIQRMSLNLGQALYLGDFLTSPQGHYRLVMHSSGNLVIYNQASGAVKWNSNTSGDRNWAILQSDGNFVIYNSMGNQALWHSKSAQQNTPNEMYMALQDDGNLVIYKPDSAPVWSSSTGLI